MQSITLYDIGAEDLEIHAKLDYSSRSVRVNILVRGEDGILCEENTHICAWDSIVYFAKQIICEDERMNESR